MRGQLRMETALGCCWLRRPQPGCGPSPQPEPAPGFSPSPHPRCFSVPSSPREFHMLRWAPCGLHGGSCNLGNQLPHAFRSRHSAGTTACKFWKMYLYLWLNKVKEKAAYIGHGERLIQSNFHFIQHRDTKGQDTHKYRYLE